MNRKRVGLSAGMILGLSILPWMCQEVSYGLGFSKPDSPAILAGRWPVDEKVAKSLVDNKVTVDLGVYKQDGHWSKDPKKADKILGRAPTTEILTVPEQPWNSNRRPGAMERAGSYLAAATDNVRLWIGHPAPAKITVTYRMQDTQENFLEALRLAPDVIKGNSRNWADYNCKVHMIKRWTAFTHRTKIPNLRGAGGLEWRVKTDYEEIVSPEFVYVLKSGASATNTGGTP